MRFTTSQFLFAVLVLSIAGCGDSRRSSPPPAKSETTQQDAPGFKDEFGVYATKIGVSGLEKGDGYEQRPNVVKSMQLQKQKKYPEADKAADEVIAVFEKKMTDAGTLYLSFANKAELLTYQKEHPGKNVVWFDYAYGEALHCKANLAVDRRDFPTALKLSEQELSFRPYSASAYSEYGFILNQIGKAKEGLAAYERALELCEQFESNRSRKPMSLRGVGFAKIELKDFKGARTAFDQSLLLEPKSEVALRELKFIDSVEGKTGARK